VHPDGSTSAVYEAERWAHGATEISQADFEGRLGKAKLKPPPH
jgi:hypothetical protein